jgi:RNA polymerase sigma-70 factor (ECF subfamily)
MDRFVNRDTGATFEEGIVAAYPRLFPLALQLCRNPADAHDLVQDTVERGLRCRRLFRTGGAPDRWMSTILQRIFVDRYRSRRRRAALLALDDRPAEATPDQDDAPPWDVFSVEDVRRALLFVDAAGRETFSLFTFGKLAQAEIARRLSISRQTVATRVFRTRAKLREILASGQYLRPLALVPPVIPGSVATPRPAADAPAPTAWLSPGRSAYRGSADRMGPGAEVTTTPKTAKAG